MSKAQVSWPLWQAYTAHNVDEQGRVIDHSAGDKTTSEGQSYAMFFALVDNDRPRFDKLLAWTETNLAAGDLSTHMPAWEWGRLQNGEWKIRDPNSASDSDLWIAYTLLEAGRLWHEPRFTRIGRSLAHNIALREVVRVPGLGTVLVPGIAGFGTSSTATGARMDGNSVVLNPSYVPAPLLSRLGHFFPNGPWLAIERSIPAITGGTAGQGFAMDWVSASGPVVTPIVWPPGAAGQHRAVGSYDAIRVYLWTGMTDPATPGLAETRANLYGMLHLLQLGDSPPAVVDASGVILRADSPPAFIAAVLPYLQSLGLTTLKDALLAKLQSTRDPSSGLFGTSHDYYDQNLSLFSTGWLEHRFRFERDGSLTIGWK